MIINPNSIHSIPPGITKKSQTIKVYVNQDTDYGLHIYGFGRRLSTIQITNDGPVFHIICNNVGSPKPGNIRGIVFENLCLRGGGIWAENMNYCYFRNVTFFQENSDIDVVWLRSCHHNVFDNCWWVSNNRKAYSIYSESSTIQILGGIIGEAAGPIYVRGGYLGVNGVFSHNAGEFEAGRVSPGLFTIYDRGSLNLIGSRINTEETLINVDNAKSIRVTGNNISAKKLLTFDKWESCTFKGFSNEFLGTDLTAHSVSGKTIPEGMFVLL